PDVGYTVRFVRVLPFAELLEEKQEQAIEDREKDVFLGREVVGELSAGDSGPRLDLREREVVKTLGRNDFDGRRDDLFASGRGDPAVAGGTRFSRENLQEALLV